MIKSPYQARVFIRQCTIKRLLIIKQCAILPILQQNIRAIPRIGYICPLFLLISDKQRDKLPLLHYLIHLFITVRKIIINHC